MKIKPSRCIRGPDKILPLLGFKNGSKYVQDICMVNCNTSNKAPAEPKKLDPDQIQIGNIGFLTVLYRISQISAAHYFAVFYVLNWKSECPFTGTPSCSFYNSSSVPTKGLRI